MVEPFLQKVITLNSSPCYFFGEIVEVKFDNHSKMHFHSLFTGLPVTSLVLFLRTSKYLSFKVFDRFFLNMI